MYSVLSILSKSKTLLLLSLISLALLSTSCSSIEHTAMGMENENVSVTVGESESQTTEVTTDVLNYDPDLTLHTMYEHSSRHNTTSLPETSISSVMTSITNMVTSTNTSNDGSGSPISVSPNANTTKATSGSTTSCTETTVTTAVTQTETTSDTTEVVQTEYNADIPENNSTDDVYGFENDSNSNSNSNTVIDENYFFNGDCAFIGDSLTVGISTYGYVPTETTFAQEGISLLGINSLQLSTSCGYVYPAQAIAGWQSKHVYILLGINGVTWVNTDTAIERYTQLINDIRSSSPYVEDINIISVYPVAYSMETKSSVADGRILNSEVDAFNQRLQAMASQLGLNYIDVNSRLKNEYGRLPDSLTVDGLHLTKAGYEKVRDVLLEYVKQNS